MSGYDFTGLSPTDFEELCNDLLNKELGVRFESFTEGKDSGIDLRHTTEDGKQWIVQCKNYAKTGYSKLLSKLRREERKKLELLNPSRYILITSVGLTPSNKEEIQKELSPFILKQDDIYGKDDLNALLRLHSEIENRHFKLWLTSTAVLQTIIHAKVFVQSWWTEQEIRRKLSLYVRTESYAKAKEKLESEHFCVITGNAGVGKTTLAEILIADYAARGFQIVTIDQNINEATPLLSHDPDAKQVFYYDDFLGMTNLDSQKLMKNEDKGIARLIEAVSRDAHKRFILTTREYLLNQAIDEYEKLGRQGLDYKKHFIGMSELNEHEKASIFANHLYFDEVDTEHLEAIVSSKDFYTIIRHKNFNPRTIGEVTKPSFVSRIEPSNYAQRIQETLDNPKKLWDDSFNKISNEARDLLFVLATHNDSCKEAELLAAYASFCVKYRSKVDDQVNDLFKKCLKEVDSAFVRFDTKMGSTFVSLLHGSISDFLSSRIRSNIPLAKNLLDSSCCFAQVQKILLVIDATLTSATHSTLVSETVQRTLNQEFKENHPITDVWESFWWSVIQTWKIYAKYPSNNLFNYLLGLTERSLDSSSTHSRDFDGIFSLLYFLKDVSDCDMHLPRWFDITEKLFTQNDFPLVRTDSFAFIIRTFIINKNRFSNFDLVEAQIRRVFDGQIDHLASWVSSNPDVRSIFFRPFNVLLELLQFLSTSESSLRYHVPTWFVKVGSLLAKSEPLFIKKDLWFLMAEKLHANREFFSDADRILIEEHLLKAIKSGIYENYNSRTSYIRGIEYIHEIERVTLILQSWLGIDLASNLKALIDLDKNGFLVFCGYPIHNQSIDEIFARLLS